MESHSTSSTQYPSQNGAIIVPTFVDDKSWFGAGPVSEMDLNHYKDIAEVYREVMAPTSVSSAINPDTGEKVAIKRIFKSELITEFQRLQAAQEFSLHCSLSHENILKGFQWTETEKEYILVMEYMNNADYFHEKIDTKLRPIKHEEKIKAYMKDILESLDYLHSNGIVHGDIKLENLLVHKNEGDKIFKVKLGDFGLSRFIDKPSGKFLMISPVGSHAYMAPEIKAYAYVNAKIDIWALGLVLYKMSVAYKPTVINKYKYGDGPIPFHRSDWRKRSSEIQDLIRKMLEFDPEKRISAREALEHPWFQDKKEKEQVE